MKFKKLELEPESSWLIRTLKNKHTRRSLVFIIFGATVGVLYFYFTEGRHMDDILTGDILKSMLIGGFFGFFITNSPCARNKC